MNATLDIIYSKAKQDHVQDLQSFLFSFQTNGRLSGMMKYESIKEGGAWIALLKQDDPDEDWNYIISFGFGDLKIGKYPERNWSRCNSGYQYDFHEIEYPLTGSLGFTPKRFIVIQMV